MSTNQLRPFDPSSDSPSDEPIGLLAGWGRYPVVVAQALKRQGRRVAVLAVRDHADPALEGIADELAWIRLGGVGAAVRSFRRWGVRRAVMAGKIHKVTLFRPGWWIRHRPDWLGLKTYYRHFLTGSRDCKDDSLLGAAVEAFAKHGITFEPATNFAPELLVTAGVLAGKPLSARMQRDVDFGWKLAKQMGGLDVGQTVCVKNQAVLAIEAIEGTDHCIRRAGELCPQGGFAVVKVAKPAQDMRFDVPVVGVETLETIAAAGGAVLAVEAQRTILLDADRFRAAATRLKLTVAAVTAEAAAAKAA
jgi:DUF1009 family protein